MKPCWMMYLLIFCIHIPMPTARPGLLGKKMKDFIINVCYREKPELTQEEDAKCKKDMGTARYFGVLPKKPKPTPKPTMSALEKAAIQRKVEMAKKLEREKNETIAMETKKKVEDAKKAGTFRLVVGVLIGIFGVILFIGLGAPLVYYLVSAHINKLNEDDEDSLLSDDEE
ncbi:uncharacterized protein [Antedon mediterranea]|uniref:uncharacterized protein n=1 Tax=Antedon mediterranea TaxID=105859 RepID=UPI003AF6B229